MSLVLYIEDTEDQRDLVRMMLEMYGLRVDSAPDGEAGMALIDELAPDLVIVDLGMPRMDGYRVIQRMRSEPATRDIPILVLSAWTGAKHMQRAHEAGADAFVCKPFEVETLISEVRQLLRERRAPRHTASD
jgi:DNA-binding response OmpR family regulator